MGGGAGIRWQATLARSEYEMEWWPKGACLAAKRPVNETVKVARFNAWGYQDGMDSVRGDLLVVQDLTVEVAKEDYPYLLDAVSAGPYPFLVTINGPFEALLWSGFTRGKYECIFPLEFTGRVSIQGVGSDYKTTLSVLDAPECQDWYQDVFDTFSSGLEEERAALKHRIEEEHRIAGDPDILAELEGALRLAEDENGWWEAHWDGVRVNYGAKEKNDPDRFTGE